MKHLTAQVQKAFKKAKLLDQLVEAVDAYLDAQPEAHANDDRRCRPAERLALVRLTFEARAIK